MAFGLIPKLIHVSGICFPNRNLASARSRCQFVIVGLKHSSLTSRLLDPDLGGALGRIMRERPRTLGALLWPYQCAAWGLEKRFARIEAHYAEIDRAGSPFNFGIEDKLLLHSISEGTDGIRIILDQPKWFMREGGLTLNIFVGDFRALSLAFSLYRTSDDNLQAFIGSVQGRNRDDVLAVYRDLTKKMHGIRPRDLLFEYLRILCAHLGVTQILAVADAQRHHRHKFFNWEEFPMDYDKIWADRAAVRHDDNSFSIPVERVERDMADIKPNKRSLYRKRYAFLSELEATLGPSISDAKTIRFEDD